MARLAPTLPLKSSLTPYAFQQHARRTCRRTLAVTSRPRDQQERVPENVERAQTDSKQGQQQSQQQPLSRAQKRYLEAALRVNHAGELAATLIYTAQKPPIVRAYPHLGRLMQHMYEQEAGHFTKFNELLARHRIRPTAMYPVWQAAATVLGWSTGVLGREAAMACTEAVETEIGEHYNGQVRELLSWFRDMEERGEEPGEELRTLVRDIRKIRDEELEHLDHAVENDAKAANPYELLTGVIRAGCRGAIWISERV